MGEAAHESAVKLQMWKDPESCCAWKGRLRVFPGCTMLAELCSCDLATPVLHRWKESEGGKGLHWKPWLTPSQERAELYRGVWGPRAAGRWGWTPPTMGGVVLWVTGLSGDRASRCSQAPPGSPAGAAALQRGRGRTVDLSAFSPSVNGFLISRKCVKHWRKNFPSDMKIIYDFIRYLLDYGRM